MRPRRALRSEILTRRTIQVVGLFAFALVVACAHQPELPRFGQVPGFLHGLWHGVIAPFALIGTIFTDVRMYAFPNSGGWYDLGFLLGLAVWGGGGAAARHPRR